MHAESSKRAPRGLYRDAVARRCPPSQMAQRCHWNPCLWGTKYQWTENETQVNGCKRLTVLPFLQYHSFQHCWLKAREAHREKMVVSVALLCATQEAS